MNHIAGLHLGRYDAIVFDLDGTLWLSGDPMPGAADFLRQCRDAGARVGAATNMSIGHVGEIQVHLVDVGLLSPGEPLMTAGRALAHTVATAGVRHAAVLAGPGLSRELADHGVAVTPVAEVDRDEWRDADDGRVVVMGGWPQATLAEIETAGMLAAAGRPMYVTSLEPGFPRLGGFQAGAGMMIAAARALHGFEPVVCGKPSAGYAAAVIDMMGVPDRMLMVGDSLLADVLLAQAMGADSLYLHHGRGVPEGAAVVPTYATRDLASLAGQPSAVAGDVQVEN